MNGRPANTLKSACDIPGLGPEGYARWRTSPLGATTVRLERDLILELAGNVSGRRMLDVGCGDGAFAVEMATRGAIVTGVDASLTMIEAAEGWAKQRNATSRSRWRRRSGFYLPPAGSS